MAYVYRHIRLDKNEPFYIGIGSDTGGRYFRANSKRRNKVWSSIVNKCDYKIEITHDNITWQEACSIEMYLIAFYGRIDRRTGGLANLTDGGEGVIGYIFPDEVKRRIAASNSGKVFSKERRANIGRSKVGKPAPNRGIKMSASQHEKHLLLSANKKMPVLKYSISGSLLKKYSSAIEAAKDTELGQGNITNACNRKIMYGGFLWRYERDESRTTIEPYLVRVVPVVQISSSGDMVAEYESAIDAARKNNYQKSSILRVCNGRYKQAYGFSWEFKK